MRVVVRSGRRQQPVQLRLLVEREGHHEQRVNEPHHHDDADQRAIATAARPGRDRVEDVYEILAATDRENLKHGLPPRLVPTLCFETAREIERSRSEARRVWKECVRTCRYRWLSDH